MRVDKKFAPITITLEYEDERELMLEVLRRARQQYLSSKMFFLRKCNSDSFAQKCDYLEKLLK